VVGNWAWGSGGGIYSDLGELNLFNSIVNDNETDGSGGGVLMLSGMGSFLNSSILNNEAGNYAGGLFINWDSTVYLEKVSVTGNTTYDDGGGIFNYGTLIINDSSVSQNESTNYSGGGIRNEGTAYINNTTISNNSASLGAAGIDNWIGTLLLSSSTLASNIGTGYVGGIGNEEGSVRIQNSIVSGNLPNNCQGTTHSDGYNIINDTSNCDYRSGIGDSVGTSANLGPLEGEPSYHPLLLGSGINQGNPDGCTNHQGQVLTTDQRGMPRVGRCDVGAYEYQGEFYQTYLPVCLHNYCSDFYDDFSNPASGSCGGIPVGRFDRIPLGGSRR